MALPYQREAEIVLGMWREIERKLEAAESGSDLERDLRAEASRLRDEYQRLINEARTHHRPVPPELPEAGSV